jgi:hypothetical protein
LAFHCHAGYFVSTESIGRLQELIPLIYAYALIISPSSYFRPLNLMDLSDPCGLFVALSIFPMNEGSEAVHHAQLRRDDAQWSK